MHSSTLIPLLASVQVLQSCQGFSSLVHHRTSHHQQHRSLSTQIFLSSTKTAAPNHASVGKLISESRTIDDLLHAADNLWIPPNDIVEATLDLPPHLLQQQVHNEKRLRWSAQILQQLGELAVAEMEASGVTILLSHPSLQQAVLAAAIPFRNDRTTDRETKELRYLNDALQGIYNIVSVAVLEETDRIAISPPILQAIQVMFERVENLADQAALPHAIELRWSCRGIRSKLERIQPSISFPPQPKLEARAEQLPFDILFSCIDWEDESLFGNNSQDPVERLQQEIPFETDTIVTRTGAAVQERRATAWIAQEGIGALAYSGKLMAPQPISPVIHNIMAKVEDSILDSNHPRPFFDCALCNHYPDGDSACKFHTDPEHGSHWERLTCVVAAGEPRRFAFRPIPGHSTWSEWDGSGGSATTSMDANLPAVLTLFPGDVVKMDGTCNDDFHHAVYPEQGNKQQDTHGRQGRVSLVLKRAIDRNGKKGHGVAGQGRRARRRSKYDESTSDAREQDGAINTSPNSKPRRRRRR